MEPVPWSSTVSPSRGWSFMSWDTEPRNMIPVEGGPAKTSISCLNVFLGKVTGLQGKKGSPVPGLESAVLGEAAAPSLQPH